MPDPIQVNQPTAFIEGGDLRLTNSSDGLLQSTLGLNRLHGNFSQVSKGVQQNALGFLKTLVSPYKLITKPIQHIYKSIDKTLKNETIETVSRSFKDAKKELLSNETKLAFAREAVVCKLNTTPTGLPEDPMPEDCHVVREGCPETKKLFDRLPANIRKNIQNHKGVFVDGNTGLVFSLILDKGRKVTDEGKPVLHIVFGRTGACRKLESMKSIQANHLGTDLFGVSGVTTFVPPNLRQGSDAVSILKDVFSDHELEVKGFSLGGAVATYAGIENGCKTVALCPAPLSPACQDDLGDEAMLKAIKEEKMLNLSVTGCLVSDPGTKGSANTWEEMTGHRVPHMVGEGYRIGEHDVTDFKGIKQYSQSADIWKTFSGYEPKNIFK